MMYMQQSASSINLQATLSSVSAISGPFGGGMNPVPHHPITCQGGLRYEEDGTFACEHVAVPASDARTRHAVEASIAMLLIEEAFRL